MFKLSKSLVVILPLAICCGSSSTPGDPRQPISKISGMEYTFCPAIEIRGLIALAKPEFCI